MAKTTLGDLLTDPEDRSMPQWHKNILDERRQLIENGEAQFSDWETAKKRITKLTLEKSSAPKA